MDKKIQLLDCTLRDGGFAFEDAEKQGTFDYRFNSEIVGEVINHLCVSNIDIIELGAVERSEKDKRGFLIYQSIEDISQTMPSNRTGHQMYAAFYRGPDIPLDDIPAWNPSLCDIIRLCIRYSELKKSLEYCEALVRKGYKVFIQLMLTMRYSDDELQMVIDAANKMGAYAVYFVDSYGYMQAEDVIRLFKKYDESLIPSIHIGFHAHNNMNLAFSNVRTFLNLETDRNLIVDSCVLGMGQGAGNMQTEVIADFLNRSYGKSIDYDSVLQVCESIEKFWTRNTWGYSVTNLLPAIHRVAYKYATALRYHYGLSYVEINHIFRDFPDELRHRYTPENTVKLLKTFGYQV